MWNMILMFCQPITVVAFIISSICCFKIGNINTAVVNLTVGLANFFIFYGDKIFK